MADNQDLRGQMLVNEQYLTVKQIGKGGFGVVWKAYDFSLKNFVAVKELLKDYSERKYIEMFYREALIAKNIIHDNIVRVQHFWTGSNGAFYLLMDYVNGSDLETLIKKCNHAGVRIPWELSVLICSGTLKALDHANRVAKDPITGRPYGIVYRDISPGNVLISFDGGIKLSDFGIAKTADELSSGPHQRILTGKHAYMSPEQMRADADIDHRSDIYSVGVVLYEMLSGLQLYGGDVATIKQHVLSTEFDPALLSGLGLPDDLIDIVIKALHKDREDRYEKAIEMFRDLRRLLRGKETEELTAELAEFAKKILTEELAADSSVTEFVNRLNLSDVKSDPDIEKVSCKDFIVGEPTEQEVVSESPAAAAAAAGQPSEQKREMPNAGNEGAPAQEKASPAETIFVAPSAPASENPATPKEIETIKQLEPAGEAKPSHEMIIDETDQQRLPEEKTKDAMPELISVSDTGLAEETSEEPQKLSLEEKLRIERQRMQERERQEKIKIDERVKKERGNVVEDKGKTVFEEVGDWLVLKFKAYKKRLVRAVLAVVVAAVLFGAIDIFAQITPFGKRVFTRLYPPDIVLTTVPSGALVSMKSREGKYVLSNVDSSYPIEMRKIPSKSYIVTATKDGFKTIERVVRIEDPKKGSGEKGQQKIELKFDFTLSINSDPLGAEVYIDGNRSKITPWKGELTSGEHTVKLAAQGFEELGSLAKEVKEGQCNIDFTCASVNEIFKGADPKYWTYEMKSENGEAIFSLTGHLFKKIAINSSPKNIIVHLFNESQPRGNTPLTIPLKSGEYKIRFMDPEGKYEETTRTLNVNKDAGNTMHVNLNKWVTFKAFIKDNSDKPFNGRLHLSGSSLNVVKEISNGRPVRIALPVDTYKVSIDAGEELKPFNRKVNIAEESSVIGELEYQNARLKVVVKEDSTNVPLADAYVWIENQLAGKTDRQGVWENTVHFGTSSVRVVAKGYVEQSFEKRFSPGKNELVEISMAPDVVISTPLAALPVKPVPVPDKPGRTIRRPEAATLDPVAVPRRNEDIIPVHQKESDLTETRGVIVCPYCKKEYIVGPKKLRFCTNCGRPFK